MRDFTDLLEQMLVHKASDLFVTVGRPPTLKINGRLKNIGDEPLNRQQAYRLVIDMMDDRARREFDDSRECNYAISADGVGRFRVSAFVQRGQTGMVVRRIEGNIPTFEQLHLPPILEDIALQKRGLVLFVGGTGSGKSSSLAAMLGYRNSHSSGHIVTIEDPIEFVHEHDGCIVTQREVGVDTGSYQVALRNTLRQAPDVVMIGEIRSREVMEQALAFAETGHLCLSTLHANDANQALDRILHFFPEDRHQQVFMDLSLNLKAIVAQRLVPCRDGKTRRPAIELLINTALIADHIRRGQFDLLKDVMKRSNEIGMGIFDQSLLRLYRSGEISYQDALAFADSPNEVRIMVKLGDRDQVDGLLQRAGKVDLLDGAAEEEQFYAEQEQQQGKGDFRLR